MRFLGESRKELVLKRLERRKTGSSGRGVFRWRGVGFGFEVVGMCYNGSPFYKMDGTETIPTGAIAPMKPEDNAVFRGLHVSASLRVGKMVGVCNVSKACAATLAKGYRPDIWVRIRQQVGSVRVPA